LSKMDCEKPNADTKASTITTVIFFMIAVLSPSYFFRRNDL
jgi:hypothetical protein